MGKLSRRDFLKTTLTGIGTVSLSAILEACARRLTGTPAPTNTPLPSLEQPASPSPTPTNTPQATPQPSYTPTSAPLIPPDLVVTRLGEPEDLVRRALAALGGMQRFVPRGANVIIKPNICVDFRTFEYAATTNPWVVGALVKLCLEAGAASVKVMDKPFNGTQLKAYEISGIQEQVEAAGGEMSYFLDYKYVQTSLPNAVVLKKTSIYDDIQKADVLINVPVAKQHSSSARLSLGMKNLMGVILDRSALHVNLSQCIADLNTQVRPQLTVIDAVRVLTCYGPTGGSLSYVKKLDTVIASPDIVAADSYAAALFNLKPQDLPYVVAATGMGLGRSDLENLKIEQATLGT